MCLTTENLMPSGAWRCRRCWYDQYIKHRRPGDARRKRYGISPEQFEAMKSAQGNKCAICYRIAYRLCVDHCHKTKRVRGLLCDRCNSILGIWKDDPKAAERVIEYLTRS
jgi:hypothetical protein